MAAIAARTSARPAISHAARICCSWNAESAAVEMRREGEAGVAIVLVVMRGGLR